MAEQSNTRRRQDLLRAWHYYENALRLLDEPGAVDLVKVEPSVRRFGLRFCPEGSFEVELRAWVERRLQTAQLEVERALEALGE